MTEDRDALLQHYRQSREELLSAIDGLSDAQLTDPSLDGWSVKDHLAHLALWDDVRASEVVRHLCRPRLGLEDGLERQDGALNALGYALGDPLADQIRWRAATARRGCLRPSRRRPRWTGRVAVRRSRSAQWTRGRPRRMDQALARGTRHLG